MDNTDRPSTFFTNIHSIEIPKAELHNTADISGQSNTPPEKKEAHPTWLIPLATALILIQITGVALWFGYRQQKQVQEQLNETIAKLQLIEKHGYDVKGYYSELNNQSERLRSPLAALTAGGIKGTIAEIDLQVSTQYSQLLDNEKKELMAKVSQLEQAINDTAAYSYSSKTEVISFVQDVKEKISTSPVSIQQVEHYSQQTDAKEKSLTKELLAARESQLALLETKMSKATYYDFPSHKRIEEYIRQSGDFDTKPQPTTKDIVQELKIITTHSVTVDKEMEEVKKEVILNNIAATTNEVDILLAFFAQRNGYTNEMNQLNQYKNNVTTFTGDKTTNVTSDQLQKQVDKQLFALLTMPRQSKIVAEEKERQERLVEQKKLADEKGIPLPPLDVPKLVLIDVTKQRLYAYENGLSIFDVAVPVTTGMRGFDTVKGQFAIYLKATNFRMRSPFPGIFYDNVVQYWMPFFQGYGLHDASWRSVYGTMDYPAVGSHGCVNMPLPYVQRLYAWAEIGTTVIVR